MGARPFHSFRRIKKNYRSFSYAVHLHDLSGNIPSVFLEHPHLFYAVIFIVSFAIVHPIPVAGEKLAESSQFHFTSSSMKIPQKLPASYYCLPELFKQKLSSHFILFILVYSIDIFSVNILFDLTCIQWRYSGYNVCGPRTHLLGVSWHTMKIRAAICWAASIFQFHKTTFGKYWCPIGCQTFFFQGCEA